MSHLNSVGGIYIHIPYCKSKCGYCAFNSSTDQSTIPLYIQALKQEISEKGRSKEVFDTIYIGGGTPSVLPCGKLEEILSCVRHEFNILPNAEVTVEANPDSATDTFFLECKRAGVNRVSLGLQSDNDLILKKLSRPHTYNDFLSSINSAKKAGITNISADLMLGLNGQSLEELCKTVKNVSSNSDLTHISLYALKIEEGTQFYSSGQTVDDDLQAAMYEHAVNILHDNGFNRYEVSNFAKESYQSKHNQKYWHLSPYIGLGLSAHSFYDGFRFANTEKMHEYLMHNFEAEKTQIELNELIEEYIMLSLRTSDGVDCSLLKNEFNYDILTEKKKQIEHLVSMNAIIIKNNKIILCNDSYYILNSVILKLI